MTMNDTPSHDSNLQDIDPTLNSVDDAPFAKITADGQALHLPVDIEHGGIRLAGCSTFFIVSGVTFMITSAIAPEASLLLIFASVILASIITYVVDLLLKGRWLSGRELIANDRQILLQNRQQIEKTIDCDKHANILLWRFEVTRTGRVKRGWYVLGIALEQDGEYLTTYGFCSPEVYKDMAESERFTHLERRRKQSVDNDSKRDMKLAGEQRRLQAAEDVRGLEGAELTFDNFVHYLDYLLTKQTQWL